MSRAAEGSWWGIRASQWIPRVLVPVGLAMGALGACGGDGGSGTARSPAGVRLDLTIRSAPLPYSRSSSFAVTAGGQGVCMLESYDVEIVCGDRAWTETRVIAREGRGPGEIGPYGSLLSWAAGAVAYRDGPNTRVSFFSADLSPAGSVRVPRGFPVMQSTVEGTLHVQNMPTPGAEPRLRIRSIDLTTGEERAQRLLTVDPAGLDRDSVLINGAVVTPGGGYLARLRAPGWDGLAWFDADGVLVDRTELPDYGSVYPSEREMEVFLEDVRRLEQIAGRPFGSDEAGRYGERPLGFFPRGAPVDVLGFDGRGRLWARSTRPGEVGSYFELFENHVHVGSIEVPGRVEAFQIVDTLLVALVEAMEPDSMGVYPRRFDWYRIVEGSQ